MARVTYTDLDGSAPRVAVQVVNPANQLIREVVFVDGQTRDMDAVPAKLFGNPWFAIENDAPVAAEDDDREAAIALLEENGVKVDRRWGAARIAEELRKAGL